MEFSSLNDDCTRLILERLPTQQLFRLRLTCQRWNTQILYILHTTDSVKLFGSGKDLNQYYRRFLIMHNLDSNEYFASNADHLVLNSSYRSVIRPDRLVAWFGPQLERLFVNVAKSRVDLPAVLETYGGSLKTLTLFQLFFYDRSEANNRIWPQLVPERMSSLRCLHLIGLGQQRIPATLAPTLARLEQLTVMYYMDDIASVLRMLGSGLTHLRLYYVRFGGSDDLSELFTNNLNPAIFTGLKHLGLGYLDHSSNRISSKDVENLFTTICVNFTALEYLDTQFARVLPLSTQLTILATAPQTLTSVRICIEPFNSFKSILQTLAQRSTIPPAKSIQTLYLYLREDNQGTKLVVPQLFNWCRVFFPNAKELHLKTYSKNYQRQLLVKGATDVFRKHFNVFTVSYEYWS